MRLQAETVSRACARSLSLSPILFASLAFAQGDGPGFPPGGDDIIPSLGSFRIYVAPAFRPLFTGYPGYNPGTFRLQSPTMFDPATVIGRSNPHTDGSLPDTGGTPVGSAGTIIGDGSFSYVPPGFQGPAGTNEVHTEVRSFNLADLGGSGARVRAGTQAPLQPISPGEVESQNTGGIGVQPDFPADSFFDVFVDVDLPPLGSLTAAADLYNRAPLLVVNSPLLRFPPMVIYIHGNTSAVPIYFRNANPPQWNAGDCLGWLVLAGHGAGFTPAQQSQFDQFMNGQPELPLPGGSPQITPSGMTNSYGAINNSIPWGPFVPTGNTQGEIMVQQIEDEFLGRPAVLQGMAFRHAFNATHVAKVFRTQLTLADAATPSATISATFANNYLSGGSRTVVLDGTINFPPVGPYVRPPAAFDAPILFPPYVHTGAAPLMWEAIIFQSTPVTPTQFYERGPGTTHTAGWIGHGCPIVGSTTPLAATGTISGTAMVNNLASGPVNSPAALMIGDTSPTYFGLPLPLNLGSFGWPACDLNINALLFLTTGTSGTGSVSVSIPYTMSPAVSGSRLRAQWLAFDPGNLGIVTSNGLDHSVPYNATTGQPWPQQRVYANGWGSTPPSSGTIQVNGLVVEWTL